MKILKARDMVTAEMKARKRAERDAAKAAMADPGLYVSRQVLNGKDWEKWATTAGVPSPLAAADIHVTICASPIRVNIKPLTDNLPVGTSRATVCMLGPNEDALAVVFECWPLLDRWYDFYSAGAYGSWSSYRPHLTLSYDAKDFQISDEALASMPEMIILGPEIYAPFGKPAVDDTEAENDDDPLEDVDVIIIAAALKAAGADDVSLVDEIDFLKVVATKKAPRSVAKRLSAPAVQPNVIEVAGKKYVERELTMTVAPLPDEVKKRLGRVADAFKNNDEEQLAYGWASVSTVKGEFLEDLQGDTITTKAQRQWLHSLMKGQRYGLMEHAGAPIAEVVEGVVFDNDLQKALGIDLGMEGVLTCTHYICSKTWAMVKQGEWMHSIAGRVLIEVEE